MANNNLLPNGCLLFGINAIMNWFRNRRIRKYNRQARGVEERKVISPDILFPTNAYYNGIIISGGVQNDRLLLSNQIINNLKSLNHPLIILHTGNGVLENIVARNQIGVVINDRHPVLDCFDGLEFDEILHIVTNTCNSRYGMETTARYILQIAYELTVSRGRSPYFYWLEKCPYLNLNTLISERLKNGMITQDKANQLSSLLSAGQNESPKIDTFFSDIKAKIQNISVKDPKTTKPYGIVSAIENRQILCIDIKSSANIMLMELVANSLQVAMNRGLQFSLMLDSIAFANNALFLSILGQATSTQIITLSDDLYALLGAREDIFATLVGRTDKVIVYSHSSNASCEKWSMYLGQYDKIDIANNRMAGWFQSNRWAASAHHGQTETFVREVKVKPEQIRGLMPNEAFVYDSDVGNLIQATVK